MTRDPIRRRFGKGAARLRMGFPPSAKRLSSLARIPIRYERRLTIIPVATAALIAWLLATSPLLSPPFAPRPDEAIQLVLESPPIELDVVPPQPEPTPPPRAARASRSTQPSSEARIAARSDARPNAAARPEANSAGRAPFDPNSLATHAPSFTPPAAFDPRTATSAPLPATRRLPDSAPRAMPSDLVSASRPPGPNASPTGVGPAAPSMSALPGQRPTSPSGASTAPTAELVAAAHGGDRDRRDAVLALERAGRDARLRATGPAADARRPNVSARGASDARQILAATSRSSSSGATADGWQEVPLDELPDCTPAGRQDLLKKRILLAAPLQQECSSPGESFRFVETRNLGAFLMWSRPNPGPRAGQPRDRDACDVLERALACLGDRSSQESSSR